MECHKEHSFKTEEEAKTAMRRIPQRASGVVPFRVYWCKEHKAFHFSSKVQHRRKK